jgi:hypothetical protein
MWGVRVAACALVLVAGCGGGGDAPKPPTKAEIQAAEARWRDKVDDVCFELNRTIGKRGGAKEVSGLRGMVVDAVADGRAAIREIVAVPLVEGGSREPEAFVRRLKEIDAQLAELPGGGADMTPAELIEAANKVSRRVKGLEVRAGKAALTNCLTHTDHEIVADAVRQPVFIQQIQRHTRRFVDAIPEYDEPANSTGELAGRMDGLGKLLGKATKHAAAFSPTFKAKRATAYYATAIRRLRDVTVRFEEYASSAAVTIEGLRPHQRAFSRAWREASRAYSRMHVRAGVPPPATPDAVDGQES